LAPNPRPIPRFIADNSQEGIAYGRWAERLAEAFRGGCEKIEDLPAGAEPPQEIDWFAERTWGGRTWIPATARVEAESGPLELFGHVSYVRPDEGDPEDLRAKVDFTDVLAEDNPEWKVDLNDDVIGRWRGEAGMAGDVTLVREHGGERRPFLRLHGGEQVERLAPVGLAGLHSPLLAPARVDDQHRATASPRVREQNRAGRAHLNVEALAHNRGGIGVEDDGHLVARRVLELLDHQLGASRGRRPVHATRGFALLVLAHAVQLEAAMPLQQQTLPVV